MSDKKSKNKKNKSKETSSTSNKKASAYKALQESQKEQNNNVNNEQNDSKLSATNEIIKECDFSDSNLKAATTKDSEENSKREISCQESTVEECENKTPYSDKNVEQNLPTIDNDKETANTTAEQTQVGNVLLPQKSKPPQLQINPQNDSIETTNDITSNSVDSYCPITPRRIVDVVDDASVNNAVGDGEEDYYDEDYDEPYSELLVQFLGEANSIAEARLNARRQARVEAREIRMRELERQQKEQEQNADRVFDMHTASGIDPMSRTRLGGPSYLHNNTRASSMSSRRSSEDSLEDEGRSLSLRDIRLELKDVEERFRKAMIANAQLDNERASQTYQIQLLKDKLEEIEESYAQLQREFKEKSRDCNALKRNLDKVNEELKLVQGQLNERDTLITEQGLVIVAVENEEGTDAKRALVSVENAQLLGSVQGSLDVRLKKFSEEKHQLAAEVQHLQEQLESYKNQGKGGKGTSNGPLGNDDDYEAQREANKIISDFKYKLQKAEQEIANLQASLARSETQVIRYKSTAEAAEKAEAELKIERRKLQRENREAMERLEELETSNNHLLKRLDKLKNAKSALLKDL